MSYYVEEVYDPNERAKDLLVSAQEDRKEAAFAYEQAIINAVEQGWTNVKIGKTLGVSEAAIRIYRKRKGIK